MAVNGTRCLEHQMFNRCPLPEYHLTTGQRLWLWCLLGIAGLVLAVFLLYVGRLWERYNTGEQRVAQAQAETQYWIGIADKGWGRIVKQQVEATHGRRP